MPNETNSYNIGCENTALVINSYVHEPKRTPHTHKDEIPDLAINLPCTAQWMCPEQHHQDRVSQSEQSGQVYCYSFYDGKLLRIPQDPDPGLRQAGEFTLSNPITQRRHLPTEKINALPTGG